MLSAAVVLLLLIHQADCTPIDDRLLFAQTLLSGYPMLLYHVFHADKTIEENIVLRCEWHLWMPAFCSGWHRITEMSSEECLTSIFQDEFVFFYYEEMRLRKVLLKKNVVRNSFFSITITS